MISIDSSHPEGPLVLQVSGCLTRLDVTNHLIPAIERAAEAGKVRVLVHFASDFTGMEPGAAWQDFKLGVSHWSGFDRIAVVAEPGALATAIRALAVAMPCPVRVFPPSGIEEARRWLVESLGAIHMTPVPGGVRIELLGDLDADLYAAAEDDLNAHIRQIEPFRLLLDLRQFEGWRGLTAMAAHFTLVRRHAMQVERVAVLGDAGWQKAMERVAGLFLRAEVRYFPKDHEARALAWIAG